MVVSLEVALFMIIITIHQLISNVNTKLNNLFMFLWNGISSVDLGFWSCVFVRGVLCFLFFLVVSCLWPVLFCWVWPCADLFWGGMVVAWCWPCSVCDLFLWCFVADAWLFGLLMELLVDLETKTVRDGLKYRVPRRPLVDHLVTTHVYTLLL